MANEAARPYYDRKPGEVCIQLDIYDAEAQQPEKFGSRQYFLVTLREQFLQLLQKSELHKLKAYFEKRNVLKDTTLEYFGDGCICVVCPSSASAVQRLRKDYQSKRLERFFVECFVTPVALKKMQVTMMKLKIHLWEEEMQQVETEWQNGTMPMKYDLGANEKSRRMLLQIRQFQMKFLQNAESGAGPRLREAEAKFESSFSSLINYVKLLRGNSMQPIGCLRELREQFQQQRGSAQSPDEKLLEHYFDSLQEAGRVAKTVESSVMHLFQQIRIGGESKEQLQLRQQIVQIIAEVKEALVEDAPLKRRAEGFVAKISGSERLVFAGFVSLLPCVVRLVLDLDDTIDEYFSSCSVVFKPAELEA